MRQPRNLKSPTIGNIITRGGAGSVQQQAGFDRLELLGGNIIAVLQTSIVNHEEEQEVTFRGIFKDADEPVQYAPKPLREWIWVDILEEDFEDIPQNLTWSSLTNSQRNEVRNNVLLPNNLAIGLKNGNEFVWVGSYIIPYSPILELTEEDAVADFYASIPRGSVFNSRFNFRIKIDEWEGKPEEDPPVLTERIYLPWSSI